MSTVLQMKSMFENQKPEKPKPAVRMSRNRPSLSGAPAAAVASSSAASASATSSASASTAPPPPAKTDKDGRKSYEKVRKFYLITNSLDELFGCCNKIRSY